MSHALEAFIAAFSGIGMGVYFGWQYKRFIVFLLYALRLITDKEYALSLYDSLREQSFHNNSSHRFALLTLEQHVSIMELSRPYFIKSLYVEYVAICKELAFRFVRMAIVPLLIATLLGHVGIMIYTCFLSIVLIITYQTLFVHGRDYTKHARTNILLRHAYLDAGYVYNPGGGSYARAKSQPVTSEELHETYPEKADRTLQNIDAQPKSKFDTTKITWERVWWANDIALSAMISVLYWFTNAQTIGDYLLGTIQLILCLQIFFVGVWAAIKLCVVLLAKYPEQN